MYNKGTGSSLLYSAAQALGSALWAFLTVWKCIADPKLHFHLGMEVHLVTPGEFHLARKCIFGAPNAFSFCVKMRLLPRTHFHFGAKMHLAPQVDDVRSSFSENAHGDHAHFHFGLDMHLARPSHFHFLRKCIAAPQLFVY